MTQATGDAMQRSAQAPHRVSARRTPVVTPTARWAYALRRFGRYAIWALPIFAVLAGLGLLRTDPAFSTSPSVFDHYLDHVRYTPVHLLYSVVAAFFGLVALVGVSALLAGVRGRRFAAAGLVVGLAGAAVLLSEVGTLVVRQEAARRVIFAGNFSHVVISAQVHGGVGSELVVGGSAALALGWMLLGVAVWRSRVLQEADGVLLIVSAPLLYLGGYTLHMVPILGAMLLLAAGFGLAWTASRLGPGSAPGD